MFYWFAKIFMYPYLRIYHRATRRGFNNVPKKGPLIVVANHASFLDPWFLGVMFRFRHIRYLMTNEWFKRSGLWKWFFIHNGCLAVTVGKPEPSTIKQILRILKRGGVVGIFPEGKVSTDGKLQEFYIGAVPIARRAKTPILPVAICGSFRALPKHQRVPRPRKVTIVFGELIDVSNNHNDAGSTKKHDTEIMQNMKSWINDQLKKY